MDDNMGWLEPVLGHGPWAIMLATLCYALWRIVVWGKKAVVEPVVASHMALISTLQKSIQENLPQQTKSLATIAQQTESEATQLAAQTESLLEIKMAVKSGMTRTDQAIEAIRENMEQNKQHAEWARDAAKEICKYPGKPERPEKPKEKG